MADDQPLDTEPLDSAIDWVADHTQRYVASAGEDGHMWRGYPCLVLTTRGRRSGNLRRNALIYGRDGDNYLIVGSKGGSNHHPLWYLNLVEEPELTVQVGAEVFEATAKVLSKDEKQRVWPSLVSLFPPYAEYQAKTSRDIPVVALEPRTSS
jgi:deazaflavin-dependent oxidoreductase (nitroreductase family)